jgi:hypothetical protein
MAMNVGDLNIDKLLKVIKLNMRENKRLVQETQSCSTCLNYLERFDDCKIQCYR